MFMCKCMCIYHIDCAVPRSLITWLVATKFEVCVLFLPFFGIINGYLQIRWMCYFPVLLVLKFHRG